MEPSGLAADASFTNNVANAFFTISASSSVKPVFLAIWTLIAPFSTYKPYLTQDFEPIRSELIDVSFFGGNALTDLVMP